MGENPTRMRGDPKFDSAMIEDASNLGEMLVIELTLGEGEGPVLVVTDDLEDEVGKLRVGEEVEDRLLR
jgi:hypothetical protein